MKIILTRHGQVIENLEGRLCGHLSGALTEKGIEQAQKLGHRFKREEFDIIYSSDLKRAADTAREIHKHHPTVPIIFTEKLRERYYGSLEGLKYSEIDPKFKNNEAFPREFSYNPETLRLKNCFLIHF